MFIITQNHDNTTLNFHILYIFYLLIATKKP